MRVKQATYGVYRLVLVGNDMKPRYSQHGDISVLDTYQILIVCGYLQIQTHKVSD